MTSFCFTLLSQGQFKLQPRGQFRLLHGGQFGLAGWGQIQQIFPVRLTYEITKIFSFYKAETKDSPYLLPIIENIETDARLQYESALRTYNNRLQRISKILKLNTSLTSYTARHSWATIAKSKNIPISVISEGLGHNSQQTTQIYLASFDNLTLHKANLKVISK